MKRKLFLQQLQEAVYPLTLLCRYLTRYTRYFFFVSVYFKWCNNSQYILLSLFQAEGKASNVHKPLRRSKRNLESTKAQPAEIHSSVVCKTVFYLLCIL